MPNLADPKQANEFYKYDMNEKGYGSFIFVASHIGHLKTIYEGDVDSVKFCGNIIIYRILKRLALFYTNWDTKFKKIFPEEKIDLWIKYVPICVILYGKKKCALKKLPDDILRYTSEFLHGDVETEIQKMIIINYPRFGELDFMQITQLLNQIA